MATTRDIRRLAFQALYQLDARPDDDPQIVLDAIISMDPEDQAVEFSAADRRKAFALAKSAYEHREAADTFLTQIAPAWPSHRQAAVDRAILRLAHYEMTNALVPPKVGVNEAVELAKNFSTEKSASFVNGVLDKLLKTLLKDLPDATLSLDSPSPTTSETSLPTSPPF